MTTTKGWRLEGASAAMAGAGVIFFAGCCWASYAHWASFEYRSFDLAYYVQALWQLIQGRFEGSVEDVPLLGNHVEPIIFLLVPFFFVVRHPMVLVVFQNAALAAMAPLAFQTGRQLGFNRMPALLLAIALLVTPATGYVALHEFHPEALAAPCLLLMIYGKLRGLLRLHWVGFIAALACKENMALLLGGYCAVHLVLERHRPMAELRAWYGRPLALAAAWFVLCAKVITPALNAGSIDYLALYDRLGTSAADIALKSITEPHRIFGALWHGISNGNLLWGLLLPFVGLPLLKPRWLVIALPILFQHLLSWRSSEWQIYFHYAAPLIPLFWIGMVNGIGAITEGRRMPAWIRSGIPILVLVACLAAQMFLGPAGSIISSITEWRSGKAERVRKTLFLAQISSTGSVVAPLPYLSHLAMREKLYSLHYILKGLRTLSRVGYEPPPPTDFVLVDYNDTATFDAGAGYYHPAMKTVDGRVIPSSEQLLHDFLRRAAWSSIAVNELTLFRQGKAAAPRAPSEISIGPIQIGAGATLVGAAKSVEMISVGAPLEIITSWEFTDPRSSFPWMVVKFTPRTNKRAIFVTRGLCCPESSDVSSQDVWRVTIDGRFSAGDYNLEAFFFDNSRRAWTAKAGSPNWTSFLLAAPVALGQLHVTPTGP